MLSTPVTEINPRFVSRLYPAVGGKEGFWICCLHCAVVEKSLLRAKQRLQPEGRGRIMVELIMTSECTLICFCTDWSMTLGGGRINRAKTPTGLQTTCVCVLLGSSCEEDFVM